METLDNAWYGSLRPLTNLTQTFRACHLCTFNVAAIFWGGHPYILPYAMMLNFVAVNWNLVSMVLRSLKFESLQFVINALCTMFFQFWLIQNSHSISIECKVVWKKSYYQIRLAKCKSFNAQTWKSAARWRRALDSLMCIDMQVHESSFCCGWWKW